MSSERTFTRQDERNLTATSSGGYRITHVFQYQDDEETNSGQYTESVVVESWEDITHVVESFLNFPDSAGFTVSIDIRAING